MPGDASLAPGGSDHQQFAFFTHFIEDSFPRRPIDGPDAVISLKRRPVQIVLPLGLLPLFV